MTTTAANRARTRSRLLVVPVSLLTPRVVGRIGLKAVLVIGLTLHPDPAITPDERGAH